MAATISYAVRFVRGKQNSRPGWYFHTYRRVWYGSVSSGDGDWVEVVHWHKVMRMFIGSVVTFMCYNCHTCALALFLCVTEMSQAARNAICEREERALTKQLCEIG